MLKSLWLVTALLVPMIPGLPQGAIAQEFRGGIVHGSSEGVVDLSRRSEDQKVATNAQSALSTTNRRVFQAKIKRRASGVPVIEVTFNGKQRFEMIVDTGASGTVITQKMARLLGLTPESKAKFDTANSRGVVLALSRIKSMDVDGAVARNVLVAVAGPDLDVGLLGHDFFGNYNILIKQDVVEFLVP